MIKYPGGEIAFWSITFLVVAGVGTYGLFADGKTLLGCLGAVLPLGCALVWFGVRQARWLVAGYLACSAAAACWMLISQGWRMELALVAALAAYVAYMFATWDGRPVSESPVA